MMVGVGRVGQTWAGPSDDSESLGLVNCLEERVTPGDHSIFSDCYGCCGGRGISFFLLALEAKTQCKPGATGDIFPTWREPI